MSQVKSSPIYWPGVIVIVAFVLADIIWSAFDHGLPDWDAAGHILNGWRYCELLRHPHLFSGAWLTSMLTVNFFYPPFVYFATGVLKLIFGVSPWVDALVKAIFVAVLSLSVFGITKALLKDNAIAALAVAFINLYPEATLLSHSSMLDYPLMAMVALSLFVLLRWQANPKWPITISLGLVLAATCMTKQIGAAFLLFPGLVIFTQTIAQKRYLETRKLLLAGLMPPLFAAPWLLANAGHVREYIEFTKETYLHTVLPRHPSFRFFLTFLKDCRICLHRFCLWYLWWHLYCPSRMCIRHFIRSRCLH